MVYITNITKNVNVGISGRTLKPGKGDEFEDAVAEIYGVASAEKKGLISIEMVKSVPGGVATPVKQEDEEPVKLEPEDEAGEDPVGDDKSEIPDESPSEDEAGSDTDDQGPETGKESKAKKSKKAKKGK